jgi:predicted lipoprotein with Yx(FWY)xxD motif
MLRPIRTPSRVLGLFAALLVAAACSASTTGGSVAPVATAPTVAPSVAPAASETPSAEPSEVAGGDEYEITVVKDAKLGDFIAGENGMTLYTFTPDTAPNKSTCNGDCAAKWPPFVVDEGETATAGDGVGGTIATFKRDDGTTQISYNGKPVYYFANDKAAGDANGQGVGDKWFVVKP